MLSIIGLSRVWTFPNKDYLHSHDVNFHSLFYYLSSVMSKIEEPEN